MEILGEKKILRFILKPLIITVIIIEENCKMCVKFEKKKELTVFPVDCRKSRRRERKM